MTGNPSKVYTMAEYQAQMDKVVKLSQAGQFARAKKLEAQMDSWIGEFAPATCRETDGILI